MVFSLICLALVLAIALRQGTQGLFSGMIMLLLTICCAAAAFGTYEWVGINLLVPLWRPDYALPIALAVLFGIPLLVLRLVFDRLIRRTCLLPALADRVGGGVCGLLTGMIVVGVASTAVQMVPFGNGSILGYSRVTVVDPPGRADMSVEPFGPDSKESELAWGLRPDRCAVGLASLLSSGVFSGKESFGMHHPDLIQSIGWVGAAHAEVSRFAPPGSISIARTEPLQYVYKFDPGVPQRNEPAVYDPETPKPGHEFRMVRVRLGNDARDTRKSHVFMLRQFRLVGQVGTEKAYVQHHPIALQQADAADSMNRHIRSKKSGRRFWPVTDNIYSPRDDHKDEVEIVFELPTGFKPAFLEYKREARVAVSFDKAPATADARPARRTPTPTPPPSTTPAPTSQPEATASAGTPPAPADRTDTGSGRRRRGRVRAVTAEQQTGSRFGDELPLALTAYERKDNVEIAGETLRQGHVIAEVDAQSGGTDPPIRRFDVPDDKRLLHLHVGRLESRSTLGRALSRAVETLQNYFVSDASGSRYTLVGKYAVATVARRNIVEIQYFPDWAGTVGGVRRPFERITARRLRPNDTFVLLFLVDPGAHIVSFSTGGDATRKDDLTGQNLTAPQ